MSDKERQTGREFVFPEAADPRFTAFMDHSPAVAWIKDHEYHYRYVNRAYEELFCLSSEEVIGRDDYDLMAKDVADQTRANDRKVLESGEAEEVMEKVPGADGVMRHWLVKKFPFEGGEGRTWTGGMAFEITKRVEAQQQLKDSEALYSSLVSSIPMNVFRKDLEGRITFMSPRYLETMGESGESILGKTDFDLFPKELAEKYRKDDKRVVENGETIELIEEFPTGDGERSYVQTLKTPVSDADGRIIGIQGGFWDVTEKKLAEEALRRALRRQELHDRRTPLGVIEWDLEFRVMGWNPAAEKMFGYTRAEAVGRHASFIIPEEVREHVDDIWADLVSAKGGLRSSNANLHKSGNLVQCEWHNTPLVTTDGKVIGVTSLVADVTELKAAEEEKVRIEKKLQETQKLESLGILAGGIAHDFNNLLTGIMGNASLARMQLRSDAPEAKFIDRIEEATTRAADLCSQMLAYSGKGRFVIRRIDLNDLVRDSRHLLELSISKKSVLKFELRGGLPSIMGDATQMRQIVMNLVINASEAIGDNNGVITLKTTTQTVDESFLAQGIFDDDFRVGEYVLLEVSDTGCGMDEATKKRIFDPFFTTKFTGRGLGLAALQGIVRGHGGGVHVYSKPAKGTTFRLLMPYAEGKAEGSETETGGANGELTGGLVLIVDDEDTVRSIAEEMLRVFGFEVESARDGEEGVEAFQKVAPRVELVLLDLTMPNMDGEEAFREIRKIREDVPVLLMSGFNEQEAINRFAGMGLAGFIQKPFKAGSLKTKIEQALSNSD